MTKYILQDEKSGFYYSTEIKGVRWVNDISIAQCQDLRDIKILKDLIEDNYGIVLKIIKLH